MTDSLKSANHPDTLQSWVFV